jgi:hypothetical protein
MKTTALHKSDAARIPKSHIVPDFWNGEWHASFVAYDGTRLIGKMGSHKTKESCQKEIDELTEEELPERPIPPKCA